MVATDLGYVTDDIRDLLKGVDAVLIESNYDRACSFTELPRGS